MQPVEDRPRGENKMKVSDCYTRLSKILTNAFSHRKKLIWAVVLLKFMFGMVLPIKYCWI